MKSIVLIILYIQCIIGFVYSDNKVVTAGDPSKFIFHESFKNVSSSSTTSSDWVLYKQCDSRWSADQLGYCSGTSVCDAGWLSSLLLLLLSHYYLIIISLLVQCHQLL